ncbi:MAG: hypothetical protein IBJ03_08100 [Gemmatimonadaceae bacterium]|nr:hypothetical protein [Gemmatimonadaceae bacterium]
MTRPSILSRVTPIVGMLLGATLFAACGSDPQVPSAAEATGSSTTAAPVASVLAQIPTVRITDAKGKGVRNVLVRWRVTTGGGRVVNDSVRTSGSGEASSGGWTLGPTAGTQTLTATADGVPTVTFTANASAGPVATLTRLAGDAQEGVVGTAVTTRPSVRAEDLYGNPVSNVQVTFAVTAGGGTATGDVQTSDANGIATVGGWTLGPQAGQQLMRATALGATAAAFSVTARPGPPAQIVKIAGDNQQTISGVPVNTPPGVRVVDAFANPVGNVPVTFTPGPNSGTVTGATVLTDPANGTAFVGSWTPGNAATQTLVVTSTLMPNVSATFTATVTQSLFDVDVRFIGEGASTAVRNAFTAAVAKWRSIIVGHVHNTIVSRAAGFCNEPWLPAMNETVNDVVIFARIVDIDGPLGVLGQAGPCLFNTSTRLTSVGIMEFDIADMQLLLDRGQLQDVILHEMGHVFGIGTLWNFQRSLLIGAQTDTSHFVGTSARQQFNALNTVSYSGPGVPVANVGGAGSRDSHWRESVFGRELMTPSLNSNVANPLSRITVGSLQDLGYQVNLAAADVYSVTAPIYAFPFGVSQQTIELGSDIKDIPLYGVHPNGRVELVRPARRERR